MAKEASLWMMMASLSPRQRRRPSLRTKVLRLQEISSVVTLTTENLSSMKVSKMGGLGERCRAVKKICNQEFSTMG